MEKQCSVGKRRGSTARETHGHSGSEGAKSMEDKVKKKEPIITNNAPIKKEHKDAIRGVEMALSEPKDLWVVTKGEGWKQRPRPQASWGLPVKEWSTACGWLFATNSAELFYFLSGNQVDKLKCTKCQAYGAAKSERCTQAPN